MALNSTSWISTLDDNLKLTDICMPGSHDAGMYTVGTYLRSGLFLTQSINLEGQFTSGARYFDLRPRWVDNKFVIFHGETGLGDLKIGHGPDVEEVLKSLAACLKANTGELVIANFSHFMDIDDDKKRDFTKLVHDYLGAYLPDTEKYPALARAPMSALKGKAIVRIEDHDFYYHGVYRSGRRGYCVHSDNRWFPYLPIFDKYSNKQDYEEMVQDQYKKFNKFDTEGEMFLLNWTLTASSNASMVVGPSVEEYAAKANPHLCDDWHKNGILKPNKYGKIVNIINADYIGGLGLNALAACEHVMDNRDNHDRAKVYKFVSQGTGKALYSVEKEVKAGDLENGFKSDDELSQQWIMEPVTNKSDVCTLTSMRTGYLLDGNKEKLYTGPPNGGDYQQWRIQDVIGKPGFVRIQSVATSLMVDGNSEHARIEEPKMPLFLSMIDLEKWRAEVERLRAEAAKFTFVYPHEPNDRAFQQWKRIDASLSLHPEGSDELSSDQALKHGDFRVSPNRHYKLVFQKDGNLVLYSRSDAVVWALGPLGKDAHQVKFDKAGDLTIEDTAGKVIWRLSEHVNDPSSVAGSKLKVENDGNLVVRSASGALVWDLSTAPRNDTLKPGDTMGRGDRRCSRNRWYVMAFQQDGNLVIYKGAKALWASGTDGKSAYRIQMNADGTLDICEEVDKKPKPLWNLRDGFKNLPTAKDASLRMGNDGKLSLINKAGGVIWTQA